MKLQTFLLLILAIILLGIYFFRDIPVTVENNDKRVIDSLKTVIRNDSIERKQLSIEVAMLKMNIVEYQQKINENQTKLTDLRLRYNEKVDSIRNMSYGDIQLYFAKRYENK